jgi:hypothetical protein
MPESVVREELEVLTSGRRDQVPAKKRLPTPRHCILVRVGQVSIAPQTACHGGVERVTKVPIEMQVLPAFRP